MSDFPIPAVLTRGQLTGWCCVSCWGMAEPGVPVGTALGRKLFACAGCFEAVTGLAECVGCRELVDAGGLGPDHNGDRACGDCRSEWAGLDDAGEWRLWAYAA